MSASMRKPIIVKDLIQKASLLGKESAQHFDTERQWKEFLGGHLPADLAARVTGIGHHPPELVVYADTAAWSARLRYGAEIDEAIRQRDPAIAAVVVRGPALRCPGGGPQRFSRPPPIAPGRAI
ncbi:MAG: hypothetical protein R3E65_05210 [Steroidobacteraceae bacterium]